MVKSFGIPCDFGGNKQLVMFSIGSPTPDKHPIHFQSTCVGWAQNNTCRVADDLTKDLGCSWL